jgi:hypothetical protein
MSTRSPSVRWDLNTAQQVIHRWHESGLSLPQFCRQQGLDPQRLRKWQLRLDKQSPAALVPVTLSPARSTSRPTSSRLRCVVTARLCNGSRLSLRGDDAEMLCRAIVSALRSEAAQC